MRSTALDFMKATALVLCDSEKKSDAIFLHSRDDAENEMAALVASLYHHSLAPFIVVNGTTRKQWEEVLHGDLFGGYELWKAKLFEYKVPEMAILPTLTAFTTVMEASRLVEMAQEYKWKSITISALPYHMLRCFLSVIKAMQFVDIEGDIAVYNRTLFSFDWRRDAPKLLVCGDIEKRDRIGHITGEYERIVNLSRRGEIATLEEMFAYLKRRDGR